MPVAVSFLAAGKKEEPFVHRRHLPSSVYRLTAFVYRLTSHRFYCPVRLHFMPEAESKNQTGKDVFYRLTSTVSPVSSFSSRCSPLTEGIRKKHDDPACQRFAHAFNVGIRSGNVKSRAPDDDLTVEWVSGAGMPPRCRPCKNRRIPFGSDICTGFVYIYCLT